MESDRRLAPVGAGRMAWQRGHHMLPFDLVFMDVARKESRAVTLVDPRGRHQGSFLFREHFCTEAECDCGILLIQAVWAERGDVMATFCYSFKPFPGEPELELEPMSLQSDLSERLLATFARILAEDAGYRPSLLRHYGMWRRVVDDPAHPDHDKLGGRVRGRGEAKKSRRTAPKPPKRTDQKAQRELPLEVTTTARGVVSSGAGLELLTRGPKAEGKLQQRFRKLLEKVDQLKLRLLTWRERRAEINSEIASGQAAQREQDVLRRKMVLLLDRAHSRLSKADRKFASNIIQDLAGELLRDGETESDDEELKRVYERHGRRAFAEDQAEEAAKMKAMFGAIGIDLQQEVDLRTPEQVMARAQEKAGARQQEQLGARAAPQTKRKRSAKQLAAEEKRAAEARDAHKAVQEVYRQLARAVHPDREADPVERERKTALMREINAAYEARDLLALLELQLRLELAAGESPESLAEGRLVSYIRVLEDQAKQLTVEIDETEFPFRMTLGRNPREAITPEMVLTQIHDDLVVIEKTTAGLTLDLAAFEDLAQLKAWLKEERAAARRGSISDDDSPFDIPF